MPAAPASELVTRTYVWPETPSGIAAVIVVSLISPATLVTVKPETKVRKDPAGTAEAAVKDADVPGDGGLQASGAAAFALHTLGAAVVEAGAYVLTVAVGVAE